MKAAVQNTAPPAARACPSSGRRPRSPPAAAASSWRHPQQKQQRRRVAARAQVELVDLEGVTHMLDVPDESTILEVAIEAGLDMPYDCKMGVCLRCSAKIESGDVKQPGGMISEECMAQGYALMCVCYPQTDCSVRVIPEDELVDAVMNIT